MIIDIRTRVSFNNKLILQVLESRRDGPEDFNGLPMWLAGTVWRDANDTDTFEVSKFLRKSEKINV